MFEDWFVWQAAAQLDGLDGGRTVTKENLTKWWNNKAKTQKTEVDSSKSASVQQTSEKESMDVDGGTPAHADNAPASSQAAPKTAAVKEAKDTSPAPSSAEKEARVAILGEELTSLARIKLSGDAIPSLRPSATEILHDFDLDGMRAEESVALGIKTRHVMGRFLEGSARSSKEVAALLLGGASNKPSEDEEAECMVKIEQSINMIAHLVERRPKISDGRVQADGAVKRWEVKDVADIPERYRALVDAHRKMEVALGDRMKLMHTLVTELSGSTCKSTGKLDKNLVVMKDKYLKLEEKEKKERDKLEGKLEADRKKQQQRDEKDKEKERKKAEERTKEAKTKEATAESKVGAGKASDKASDKTSAKPPNRSKKPEPVKNSGASSIMSFFAKPTGGAQPKTAAPEKVSEGVDTVGIGATAETLVPKPAQKERRNFHPWEKPKNALVAPFPYGPGTQQKCASSQSAASEDLASWLAVLRSETVRTVRTRPLREDGTPHPKMKLIQLNMKIPLVKTQLVDVDVEAEKKVMIAQSFFVLREWLVCSAAYVVLCASCRARARVPSWPSLPSLRPVSLCSWLGAYVCD